MSVHPAATVRATPLPVLGRDVLVPLVTGGEVAYAALDYAASVRVLSLFGEDAPRVGVLSFVVDGWNSSHFAAALSAEYGIGVRDGLFCGHPLVRTLLGDHTEPGDCGGDTTLNAVRVSFGAGTPDEHVDRFLDAVRTLVTEGARWRYRTENGRCVPA